MTIQFKRPMLAASLLDSDVEHTDNQILNAMNELRYPVYASLKVDGIRAIRLNGSLLSRSLKKIPNKSIRERSLVMPGGMDMELWSPDLDYSDVQSAVMSEVSELSPRIGFYVFDWYDAKLPFLNRFSKVTAFARDNDCNVNVLPHNQYNTPSTLFGYFKYCEDSRGEGICFRLGNSPYKFGRSTLKEQYLVKLCRYVTDEAVIIGFNEEFANCNTATTSEVGLSKRSHEVAGMVGKGTLGSVTVKNTAGLTFNIGTGFTATQRQYFWDNQDKFLGKTCVYRCKRHGEKILPRCPSWKGLRNTKIDL